jgi:hypothetical protein
LFQLALFLRITHFKIFCQYHVLFIGNILLYAYTSLKNQFISWWTLGCFEFQLLIHIAIVNICIQMFYNFGYMEVELLDLISTYDLCLIFWGTATVFQSGSMVICSHQQSVRGACSLHSCQRLLLTVFFIIALMVGVMRYLFVVSTCVFFMTNAA